MNDYNLKTDPEDVDELFTDVLEDVELDEDEIGQEWFDTTRRLNGTPALDHITPREAARIDGRLRDLYYGFPDGMEQWKREYELAWRLAYYYRVPGRAEEDEPWKVAEDADDGVKTTISNLFEESVYTGSEWDKDEESDRDDEEDYREKILWAANDQDEMCHPDRPDGLIPEFPGFESSEVSISAAVIDGADEVVDVAKRIKWEVIGPYQVPPWYDAEERPTIQQPKAVQRTADIFTDAWNFICPRSDVHEWEDQLYVYHPKRKIYEPYGEDFLERKVEKHLDAAATNGFVAQVTEKIERMAKKTEWEMVENEPPEGRIVVENGILDMRTGKLDPHTPEEHHRMRLPVEYHPDAEPDAIDSRIREWVNEDDVDTVYRSIAHAVYPGYPAEKAIMLAGEGQNGKSILLRIIRSLLGRHNVKSLDLQDLTDGDFMTSNLNGKLANLAGDMSGTTVRDLSTFKALTGNDEITANVKHYEPISFINSATLIFACNSVPEMQDDDFALWRRWVYINFPNQFRGDDAVPKHELLDEVTASDELQGLLARAVEESVRYHQENESWFPESEDPMEVREQLRNAAEPVYHFYSECLDKDEGHAVRTERVRRLYAAFATEESLPRMGKEKFGKRIKNKPDANIENKQKRVNGEPVPFYTNIALSERGLKLYYSGVVDEGEDAPSPSELVGEVGEEEAGLDDEDKREAVKTYIETTAMPAVDGVVEEFGLTDEDKDEIREMFEEAGVETDESPNEVIPPHRYETIANLARNTDQSVAEIVDVAVPDEAPEVEFEAARELVEDTRSRGIADEFAGDDARADGGEADE